MSLSKIFLALLCLIVFHSSAGFTQPSDLVKRWEKRIKGEQVRVAVAMVLACQAKLGAVSGAEAEVIKTYVGPAMVIQDGERTFLAQRVVVPNSKGGPPKIDTYKFAELKQTTTQYGAATELVANIFADARIIASLKGRKAPAKRAGAEFSCSKTLAAECRVPDDVMGPIKESMRASEYGRDILEFLEKNKVPFQYDDSTEYFTIEKDGCHFASTLAYWAPVNRFIGLNREVNAALAAEMAAFIAHEGFHAMWNLSDMASRSIEEEQDASFIQYITYHEIIDARPGLRGPKGNATEEYYRTKFIPWINAGNLDAFNQDILQTYSGHKNYKTLAQMLGEPNKSEEEKKKLDRAQKMHTDQQLLEQQWIREHQKEFR